ncbi:hypothetical protein [Amorphus sp. MBR-141]
MLAFADDPRADDPRDESRLLCQVTVTPQLDGMRVQVAANEG